MKALVLRAVDRYIRAKRWAGDYRRQRFMCFEEMLMVQSNTPILIGAGLVVDKNKDVTQAKTPLDLLVEAAELALADSGQNDTVRAQLDAVAGLRFITASPEARDMPSGHYPNPGLSVAHRLGLSPERSFYAPTGGNTPQFMINDLASRIHAGEIKTALLVGGEGLGSLMRVAASGADMSAWNDDPEGPKTDYGVDKAGVSATETAHGMSFPVNTYPLLENALRAHLGRSLSDHSEKISELMSRFTQVAAQHPQSWFPVARSAEEIRTVTDQNRWVGFPYPKYMNSVIQVNQAAAVLLTSVGEAEAMGIDRAHWVFLHGCADANETWFVSERQDLHRSHAIHEMAQAALSMANWTVDDLDYIDLYSCFPVAVEVGCREMGIAEDDPRGLTITGGLPYFGGAGNAYTLLSVASMIHKLRQNPGKKGLCTGNGWYLTKHSIGLYSTAPVEGEWPVPDRAAVQAKIDALPKVTVEAAPSGAGHIETYTVIHPAGKPRLGLILGRLQDGNARFVAHIADENGWLDYMIQNDVIGHKGQVSTGAGGVNWFVPDGTTA